MKHCVALKREREGWRNLLDHGKTTGRAAGITSESDVVGTMRENTSAQAATQNRHTVIAA